MDRLSQANRGQVIDVLMERLAFERAGVRLYDRIVDVIAESGNPAVQVMLGQMRENRDQEWEHAEWLERQVQALGGDPEVETERSRLVQIESSGLEELVLDSNDTVIPHLFHALYAAELVDHAGWDLLVELADDADDDAAKKEFKKRLREEEEHVVFVRKAVERFARHDILGETVRMPTSP
jgi:bacterioferritin (cytochrome b1)